MERIVSAFLKYLGIPISQKHCEKLILSHPDYPSLLSIADTLQRLGINYNAGRVTRDELKNLPFPYLLSLTKKGSELILVRNESDYARSLKGLDHWEGVVLRADSTKVIKDEENNRIYADENFSRTISIGLVTFSLCFLLYPFTTLFSWSNTLLVLTSLAGLLIGYLLIAKDLGIKYDVIESFCNAGKKINCDRILNSEDAKLFGVIKFSDLVLSYFCFVLVMLSLSKALLNWGQESSIQFVLTAASMLTLPVVFFSLYYQHFKAKTWCRLCLVVDLILIVQFSIFIAVFNEGEFRLHDLDLFTLTVSLVLFLMIFSGLMLIKGNVEKIHNANVELRKSNQVKYSMPAFTHLLFRQRPIDSSHFEKEILIGDRDAPISLIMASNLYCAPCKQQHEVAAHMISIFPHQVNLSIRFVGSTGSINRHILQYWIENIYGESNESFQTERMIHRWYTLVDTKRFGIEYPVDINKTDDSVNRLEVSHRDWITQAGISRTPSIFLNGYLLPKGYSLEDIITLMPGLIEMFSKVDKHSKGEVLEKQ